VELNRGKSPISPFAYVYRHLKSLVCLLLPDCGLLRVRVRTQHTLLLNSKRGWPFLVVHSLSIALCVCCYGLDQNRSISQYRMRSWEVVVGLPRNYVMSILQEPGGYLLVGTDGGLARFDGVRFTPVDGDPSLNLSQRWISSMLAARDGSLWIATLDGWLYQLTDGKVANRLYAGAGVVSILEDDFGSLWASTGIGVVRFMKGRLNRIKELTRIPTMAWTVLALDSHGVVWAVTVDGLFRCREGSISLVIGNSPMYGEIVSVYSDRDRGLMVGSTRGLFRLSQKKGGAPKLIQQAGIPGPVMAMLKDRSGILWVGTWGKGLYRLWRNRVDSWGARDDRQGANFTRALYEDREGNLWIGTRACGLHQWTDTPIVPFGLQEGLGGDFASTVASDPDGNLWFGTWRAGLYESRGGLFVRRPTPVPRVYCTIQALALDLAGHPWIADDAESLYGFDGHRFESFSRPDSPYRRVGAILFDQRGRLWLGTSDNGLFLFPGGRPTKSGGLSFLQGVRVTALLEDSMSRVWVGSESGFGYFPNADVLSYRQVRTRSNDSVTSISEDTKGNIWVATLTGTLYALSSNKTTVLNSENGLPRQALYRVVDDGAGSLWISSPRGILEISEGQVAKVTSGAQRRLDVVIHNQDDGMRTMECHGVSQPAGARDRNGMVWFPTAKGFVRIQHQGAGASPAPPVLVEELVVDGRPLSRRGELDLKPGTQRLEIRYTALNLSFPKKLRFRYRMEGLDPDWVDAGESRTAHYIRIPPGRYRFVVAARLPPGAWSGAPATIEIHQIPRLYQTAWFLVGLGLILISGATVTFLWRDRVIQSRYALVVAERNRIAREWHDTLLAGFSAISWQLEETMSRLNAAPERAGEAVGLALRMVQHCRAEARRVIWDLRENRDTTETLADSVSCALRQITAGTGIDAVVDVSGRPTKLSEELERNVLRICQEAASNAKIHGRPSSIGIRMEYKPAVLRVCIEDDGRGVDPREADGLKSGHFGLIVMRERAERFGGDLRLERRPGGGTIVEATIPVRGT
jgi:ligand-binding sensor domain-containing protein/signal transduction histidine kinase